jgi:hypothetical protein
MASLGMRAPVEVGAGFLTLLPRMATFEVLTWHIKKWENLLDGCGCDSI